MDKISLEDFRKIATQKQLLMDNTDILFIMNDQNNMVNEFCDKVLPRYMEPDGTITKTKALQMVAVYATGREVRRTYEHFKMLKFDEKAMKEIIETLQKPVPELYMIGQISVQIMFSMFDGYVKKWWNEQRYTKIYKSDNPHKWVKKIEDYPEIDNASVMFAFHNYGEVQRKVADVLNTKIRI